MDQNMFRSNVKWLGVGDSTQRETKPHVTPSPPMISVDPRPC